LLSKQASGGEDGFSADALPCNEIPWAKAFMDTERELESIALDAFVIVMFNEWTCDHFRWCSTGTYSEHPTPKKKIEWQSEMDLGDVPWLELAKVYGVTTEEYYPPRMTANNVPLKRFDEHILTAKIGIYYKFV